MQCCLKLRPAIAFQTAQQVAGETGGMQARQHWPAAVGLTDLNRIMLLAAVLVNRGDRVGPVQPANPPVGGPGLPATRL